MTSPVASGASGDAVPAHRPVVYWYPSFRCNLACRHCSPNSSPNVDTSSDLTTEECLQVVEQLKELRADRVILSGGEPLLRADMKIILRSLLDNRIPVSIETNALLIDDELMSLLQWGREQRQTATHLAISLDGGTADDHEFMRGKGTFERTLANLHMLKARGWPFSLQAVLNARSIRSIPDLYQLATELAPFVQPLVFTFLNPVGRGEALHQEVGTRAQHRAVAFAKIVEGMDRFPGKVVVKVPPAVIPPEFLPRLFVGENRAKCSVTCSFPTLGVLNDGRVTICALTREDPSILFGNLRSGERLAQIWKRARLDLLRQKYLEADIGGICGECRFREHCKGACRAWSFEKEGNFEAGFPLCEELDRYGEFPSAYRIQRQDRPRRPRHLPVLAM